MGKIAAKRRVLEAARAELADHPRERRTGLFERSVRTKLVQHVSLLGEGGDRSESPKWKRSAGWNAVIARRVVTSLLQGCQ